MPLPAGPGQDVAGAGGEECLVGTFPGNLLVRPFDGASAKRSSWLRGHKRNVPVTFPHARGSAGRRPVNRLISVGPSADGGSGLDLDEYVGAEEAGDLHQ
jgi:hypothetical protein